MARTSAARGDNGSISTGRIITFAVLFIVAGTAAPRLHLKSILKQDTAGGISRMANKARTLTTRQRMRGIKAELKLWTSQHGVPEAGDFSDVVGRGTTRDAWGHTILYVPPSRSDKGCLRSYGPDGRLSKDDIVVLIIWDDLNPPGDPSPWH